MSNEWLQIYRGFDMDPRVSRAKRGLGESRATILGHLLILWLRSMNHYGSLREMTPEDIADLAQWRGDPERFVQVLTEVELLEEDAENGGYCLPDWDNMYEVNN